MRPVRLLAALLALRGHLSARLSFLRGRRPNFAAAAACRLLSTCSGHTGGLDWRVSAKCGVIVIVIVIVVVAVAIVVGGGQLGRPSVAASTH